VTVARELGGRKVPGVTARRRAVVAALDAAAEALGNTRAVARSSYVDPRVLDLFEEGRLPEIPRGQVRGEQAVLRVLGRRDPRSPAG
jgi:DNA topoisomerase IB